MGHNHPSIRDAVLDTVVKGTSFGTPNKLGNQIGKLIIENNSFVEKIRFVSSGTEAVMSAIRLARGVTGKSKIIKFEGCYHGHVDSLMVKAGSGLATFGVSTSAGIPPAFAQETIVIPLNQPSVLEEALMFHADDIACVIIEPIPANNGLLLQTLGFLRYVQSACYRYKVLLIFDEVISGFRVGFEGAAGYYDVQPDIVTYGKIIGGGMPVGAYGASAELMSHIAPEGPVYQAGTLSANPVAMAAGYAALQELLKPNFYKDLEEKTAWFTKQIEDYCHERGYEMSMPHIGSIFWVSFSRAPIEEASQIDSANMEKFKVLHHELLQRGVYLEPSGYEVGFISAAHQKVDLEEAIEKICTCMDIVFGG